ncbi:MAG: hypothetical protein JJE55_14775 [Flavobacteriaceae bacterium]|nr:hypothetical protein [Flavobacteriaceae bacterium]
MRRCFIFIFFLVFATSSWAQPKLATITFIDGSLYEGFADITQKLNIEFRLNLDEEPDTFDGFDVKRISFNEKPYEVFEYIFIDKKPELLIVLSEGELVAYAKYIESFSTQKTERQLANEDYINAPKSGSYSTSFNGQNIRIGGPYSLKISHYYIKKKGSDSVEDLKMVLRKKRKEYFGNCSGLMKKLKSKEYIAQDIKKIADYYNDFCTEL